MGINFKHRNVLQHDRPGPVPGSFLCCFIGLRLFKGLVNKMLKVDAEFKALIPALSEEEFQQLEKNILVEGIQEELKVWHVLHKCCGSNLINEDESGTRYCGECKAEWNEHYILIDGHNRYEIAQKHGLEYKIKHKYFDSRKEVTEWMILNQFGRRNLSAYQRSLLALKLKPVFEEKAKEKQIEDGRSLGGTLCQKSDKGELHTSKELAKVAGVSHDTIAKVQKIEEKAPEKIKEQIKQGNISINKAYQDIKKEEAKIERKENLQSKAKELPAEKFQVIYCDPPWQYSNSGLNGCAEKHYPTMSTEDLCNMKVKTIVDDNAVIFMWATNPLLEDALQLMKSWGFDYKTNMVWVKNKENYGGLGFYIYGKHELLLIGIKGSLLPIGDKPISVITGSNDIHSKKPEHVYDVIESMYPGLKYVELFARNTPRDGWLKWGNEVGKYD